jgi:4-amino-4-deoxy-L-arabinose transferase-like glycosyltransferase
MDKSNKFTAWIIGGVILVAILWRMSFVIWNVMPFDADEAIVGLMAKHILAGERPLFFYGQYYMGSLDAYLVSLGFLLLGQKVWVIRLVQALLFGATLYLVIQIGKEAFGDYKVGLFAALLLAIPNVSLLVYSTASLGGYGETLLFSALILLISFHLKKNLTAGTIEISKIIRLSIFLGIASGVAFWVNSLTAVVSFPCAVFALFYLFRAPVLGLKRWAILLILAVGFGVGLAPIWISIVQNGFSTIVKDLMVQMYTVESGEVFQRIPNHLFTFFFLGLPALLGIRPPWNAHWLAIPILPFLIAFFLIVLIWFFRKAVKKPETKGVYLLFSGIVLFFFILFLCTPFGVDPSGRYFLPLNILVSLLIANYLVSAPLKRWMRIAAVSIILVFNVWSTLQCALQSPPGLTINFAATNLVDRRSDPELISFLEANNIDRGYSTYWVSYPLAFLSNEKMIFLPQLPYHESLQVASRDDRYQPYHALVDQASTAAYITAKFPKLDDYLRSGFERLNITWQEKNIGDYHIFYNLSQKVTPQDLGFEFEY